MTAPQPDPALDPDQPMSMAELVDACAHLGMRLSRALRDASPRQAPDRIAALLAEVPEGRTDVLAVTLAAMLDTTGRTPGELLAWTEPATRAPRTPARPRAACGSPGGYGRHRRENTPVCTRCQVAQTVSTRPPRCRAEFARLVRAGVPVLAAAELTKPSNLLTRRTEETP